jgi:ribosomal protein RSM22 (predicted rRNA methylase)
MQTISAALLARLPQASLSTKLLQTSLGSPDLASMLDNAHPQVLPRDTMALAAFTLGDLPSDKVRRETVRAMWDSGAEVIVIIDRGTPKGFDLVATARDQLLRLGRHTADRTAAAEQQQALMDEEAPAVDQAEELTIGDTTFFAQEEQASTVLASPIDGRGCHIVAPVRLPLSILRHLLNSL